MRLIDPVCRGTPALNAPLPPPPPVHARSARFVGAFGVTALLFALGQFHRSSGSVLSSVFIQNFGLAPGQVGVVIGVMFIAQAVGQIPSGVLIDRFGTRRTLATMSALAALGCLTVALADHWGWLMLGRAMIGFGFSAAMMGSFKLFAAWVPPAALTRLTGRFMFFGLMGGVLATAPLIFMLHHLGWRGVFVVFALATATMAALVALVVRDRPPATANTPADPPETLAQVIRGLAQVVGRRELRLLILTAPMLYLPAQMLVGLWAMPYLSDVHGLDAATRGTCLLAMVTAMSLGPLVYGQLDARLGRFRVIVGGTLFVAAGFAALALWGASHWLFATTLCAVITGGSTFFLLILSHAQLMFRPGQAGRVVSSFGVLGLAGVFCAQTLSALLLGMFPAAGATASATGYAVLFAIMAAMSVLVALLCLRFRQKVREALWQPGTASPDIGKDLLP
jgi:MFS family permease